jgi:hypothetical protein
VESDDGEEQAAEGVEGPKGVFAPLVIFSPPSVEF